MREEICVKVAILTVGSGMLKTLRKRSLPHQHAQLPAEWAILIYPQRGKQLSAVWVPTGPRPTSSLPPGTSPAREVQKKSRGRRRGEKKRGVNATYIGRRGKLPTNTWAEGSFFFFFLIFEAPPEVAAQVVYPCYKLYFFGEIVNNPQLRFPLPKSINSIKQHVEESDEIINTVFLNICCNTYFKKETF